MQSQKVDFDEYAEDYDSGLGVGLSWTGESRDYFANRRMEWLKERLKNAGISPRRVLDFGCGTGSSTPFFFSELGVDSVIAVDESRKSLEIAERDYGRPEVQFIPIDEYEPRQEVDLAFCNGVFHHIPVDARPDAIRLVHDSLRPDGLFALWENNPWNPATHILMKLAPIDVDAVKLRPAETRRLLRAGGFDVLQTDFLFIFPRLLQSLRRFEAPLAGLPLGIQYLVLAAKRA
jgi:trans-aconitate methyltransferase